MYHKVKQSLRSSNFPRKVRDMKGAMKGTMKGTMKAMVGALSFVSIVQASNSTQNAVLSNDIVWTAPQKTGEITWLLPNNTSLPPKQEHKAETLSSQWKQEAHSIFKKLGIHQYQEIFDGKYFAMAQMSWGFQESEGFDKLLQRLEKNHIPFEQIEVLPGQFLLSNMSNAQQKSIVLWVKRQENQAYSGALSIMQGEKASLDSYAQTLVERHDKTQNTFSSEKWVPAHSEVLLDIENYQPEISRQWIYVLPFVFEEAQHFVQEQLKKSHWKRMNTMFSGIQVWQQDQEEMIYQLSQLEGGKTGLFLMKRQRQ